MLYPSISKNRLFKLQKYTEKINSNQNEKENRKSDKQIFKILFIADAALNICLFWILRIIIDRHT
ncbi:hypothetical protein HMPREF9378_0129 [Streptococcus sanguinis SK1 = NCTC 7863]|uniref:Uncharacterized protein n=2 Tax=Streptococcus sanguinis TaxID=1305 RepID=F0IWD7_STRSA|nr:hypothetical protein HMPREF9392_1761 [Streptococcus sanguinis SK678]EGD38152.1 hypothetical protein HMPREF9384_2149 [Streptococcus sanguinis SK160]EGF09334.1 hypothetical protein HMPREF9378_0129 [Streptococcus sanguinis SK1 = NCTC 7863]EGF21962.1 hypothetical protein HMPREF9395_0701 [Streptococcus sanguinis SK1058]EGG40758.1 hypothetical protein HMPREF9397_0143 [Streptococcus sanguinis SK1087]